MKLTRWKIASLITALAMMVTGCVGTGQSKTDQTYTADNEIITYKMVDTDKRVVTIGKYDSFDETRLEQAIETEFPELDIVFEETLAGPDPVAYMAIQAEQGDLPDIQLCKHNAPENDFLYNLSAEDVTGRYNLSSLNGLNVDGKLYQLPIINTVKGIVYNKTLFKEHGWTIPETLDEFYALCDQIAEAGIRPFACCTKYVEGVEHLALGFSYDDTLSSMEKQLQYNQFIQGEASCENLLEPAFNVLRTLYEKGLLTDADFTSSISQHGYDLYDGKIAMAPRDLDILGLAETENLSSELGIFGYPTQNAGQSWMQLITGCRLSVSKAAMEDTQQQEDIRSILNYISTNEGQKVLQEIFFGISSLTSYQQESAQNYEEIQECMNGGRVLYTGIYGSDSDVEVFHQWVKGEMTMAEMIEKNDGLKTVNELEQLETEPVGKASEAFTVLDTSLYNADMMQKATGAPIALMLNRSYFKGNMASIYKGEIVYPERFILKGVAAKDSLTTYEITGANLKALMEHPIINGAEVNALYAPAGLKMEYAPWADTDANVLSLTLADGSEIDDKATYTVAAWAKSIDDQYISKTLQTYSEVGDNQELMTKAIQSSGTIAPAKDGRVTLNWSVTRQ
ncbi:ABC transporter substrate-binding protein [Eubacterium limosum]|nr:ABC transporter substrate-binding protein [Eubacterium limosum]